MMKTISQLKAAKSFNYQANKASKCRHEKYQISCMSCPEREDCEIRKAVLTARLKM
jgi:hypothetical protein